jgi:hypothetical protein
MLAAIKKCSAAFEECRAAIKESNLGNDATRKKENGFDINQGPTFNKISDEKPKPFPAHEIRKYANKIHKLLLQSWKCSCDTHPCPYTSMRLRLAARIDAPDKCDHNDAACGCRKPQFDLLFRSGVGNIKVASDMTPTDESWQHCEIHVLKRRYN